jgi:surfeit locus 1 family protein
MFRVKRSASLFLLLIPVTASALGTWQVYRYRYKRDLIEKVRRELQLEPIPLPDSKLEPQVIRCPDTRFRKYYVIGSSEESQGILVGPKYRDHQRGYCLVMPYTRTDDHGQGERILIHYGWIAESDLKLGTKEIVRSFDSSSYPRKLVGFLSLGEPGWFWWKTSSPSIDHRGEAHYRWLNVNSLANALDTLPVMIETTETMDPRLKVRSDEDRLNIPNNHLQYIITWYSLAAITTWMWLKR